LSSADPFITRVQPLRPRGLKVLIHLDEGDPFEAMLEALERSRLGVGDALPANKRHHLLDADENVRVRDAALNLISYRARTRSELQRRLRQKGFRPARIDACLDRLQERGFIDDEAVAAAFVRDRLLHRPRGKARLSAELREKGVTSELAERVIQQVFEDQNVTDHKLAREVAEGWIGRQNAGTLAALAQEAHGPERDKARRRLNGYMARRGFRGDEQRHANEVALKLAKELTS
jgi:SOS response regulatory protein OraA/RecX